MSLVFSFFSLPCPTTHLYTLSLHDALPISPFQLIGKGDWLLFADADYPAECPIFLGPSLGCKKCRFVTGRNQRTDRKSTRLNSSHLGISYAVFCLKKKKKNK